MESLQATFPVFEANQVLANSHLNQLFNYLDEQERLTRANLIGIGIVCGLELRLDAATTTIHLSKGCGITSEGYFIMEPDDVALVAYRNYTLPGKSDYAPFINGASAGKPQYALWELFPAGEPGTKPLTTPANFLNDKALLLFLELKQDALRTCSPNDCDDKGAAVTGTLRRLLIGSEDLKAIIAAANNLGSALTFTDLATVVLARLNLPDLRLPRYDVPNTGPVTSNEVLAAFHAVFRTEKLVAAMGAALTAAYNAFKPLLQGRYPTDPFATFTTDFGFLDDAPTSTDQVRFLQYYYDFFNDLQSAYDEFRWQGVDLLCACCPPGELFPRHLMLGLLFPATVAQPSLYRHAFLASAATSDCAQRTIEVELLFQRLVEMTKRFTHTPALAPPAGASATDSQIRVTPSKLADVPLSAKAIPYYYQQTGEPPLYQLWNAEKSRRNRANQNLSYRADEYTPAAPAFVQNPLRYDLEPHNFLRIEGHLGKPYRSVLSTLLALRTHYRLPIEIIALRAGAFDETIPVDLRREQGRFQDLETLYDTLREDLLSTLCEGARYLYDIAIEMPRNTPAGFSLPGGVPQLPLLKTYAPNYRYKPDTVGAWYEKHLSLIQSRPYLDVDQTKLNANQVLLLYCGLFTGTVPPTETYYAHIVSIYYFTKLAEILPDRLDALGYADVENKYQDLMGLIRYFRSDAVQNIAADLARFIPQEDLIDHFDQVLFACKFDPIKTAHEEYGRRIRAVKQKQFLSFFLQDHPGIQHKAGVPLGGTFIIVYHEDPAPVLNERRALIADTLVADRVAATEINRTVLADTFARIGANPQLLTNPDIRWLLGTFTGLIPDINLALPPTPNDEASTIIAATVANLANGTVIADFFLPYRCGADGSAVQYVLPVPPLGLTVELGCTDPKGTAEAKLTPQGGMAPFTYQLDNQPFRALTGTLQLAVGDHTLVIRDSAGAESAPQSITVPEPLRIGAETYTDDVAATTYTVRFGIAGGTPPYTTIAGTITGSSYTSPPVTSGNTITAAITDGVGCTISKDFTHTIPLPPLGLTVELGCTAPSGRAEAKLTPQGGVAPISYQVDNQPFQPLTGAIRLSVGAHTLVIRDSAGAESAPQSITVPAPLTISQETYIDDVAQNTYRVSFIISGGAPPYTAGTGTVTGSIYTSPPVNSGATIGVTIVDSVDCSVTKDFSHTVPEDCNLPCDGQSRRCAYRLWLQRPLEGASYEVYRQEGGIRFRFNGEDIDLADVDGLLQIATDELNRDFNNAIGGAIKLLNLAINQVLIEKFGHEGNNRLVITYKPNRSDPFDILWIEHFVCETFTIEFNFSFAKPSPAFALIMRYTNEPNADGAPFDGAILFNRRSRLNPEIRVPAFDCSERNQCENTEYTKLCVGPEPKPTIELVREGNQLSLTGRVDNLNENEIIAWIWDFLTTSTAEPFYAEQKVEMQVQNPSVPVRLTAITQNGCFGIAFENLDR